MPPEQMQTTPDVPTTETPSSSSDVRQAPQAEETSDLREQSPETTKESNEQFDFSFLTDTDEEPVQAAPETAPPEPEQTAPTPTPEETKQQPPVEAAAPVQPETVAEAAQPETTPQFTEEQLKAQREQYVKDLTSSYSLTEEEAEGIQLDPGKTVPIVAARLHARVMEDATKMAVQIVQTIVPMAIERHEQQNSANRAAEEELLGRWPGLKEHIGRTSPNRQHVYNVLATYRRENPNASKEELIERAGAMALVRLGLPLEQARPQVPVAPQPAPPRPLPPIGSIPPSNAAVRPDVENDFDFTNIDYTTS